MNRSRAVRARRSGQMEMGSSRAEGAVREVFTGRAERVHQGRAVVRQRPGGQPRLPVSCRTTTPGIEEAQRAVPGLRLRMRERGGDGQSLRPSRRLWIHPGQEAAFEAFEREAARIMARHGGRIDSAVRPDPVAGGPRGHDATPLRTHVVSFPDEAACQAYANDPETLALRRTAVKDHLAGRACWRAGRPGRTELACAGEAGRAAPIPPNTKNKKQPNQTPPTHQYP